VFLTLGTAKVISTIRIAKTTIISTKVKPIVESRRRINRLVVIITANR
jgi:hypothetical protein